MEICDGCYGVEGWADGASLWCSGKGVNCYTKRQLHFGLIPGFEFGEEVWDGDMCSRSGSRTICLLLYICIIPMMLNFL